MPTAFYLIMISLSLSFSSIMDHFVYKGNLDGTEQIEFNLNQLKINSDGSNYKFEYEYTGYVMLEGMPELPVFSTFIEIEPGHDYFLDYSIEASTLNINKPVRPVAELTLDRTKHAQGLSRASSPQTEYPKIPVKISEPMVMRGVEVIRLEIIPFKFNPVDNSLTSYDIINIGISKGDSRPKIRYRKLEKLHNHYNNFSDLILNSSRTSAEYNNPAILFICGGSLADNDDFNDLVHWKHKRGYEVTVESVSNIGNSTSNIKNYIQQAYNNWDNPPTFVCFVGDANGSYAVPTYTEYQSGYNGEGDHPYSQLDGNDLIPDVAIGRLPVRTQDDMATITSKIIGYEKAYTNLQGQNDWFEKAALLGDPSDSGISTIITNEYLEQIMEYNGYENIQTNYGNGSYSSWMRNQISSGVSYFNYRGFYGVSGFDYNDVDATSNGFKLPFITTMTCGTGSFAGSEGEYDYCLSEKFVVAGSASNPKGGVAAIATATIGTHTMYNNAMNLGVYEGIFTHNVSTAGEALNYGKFHLINSYIGQTQTYTSIFCHWHSLMGDPSLHLWTDTPFSPIVNFSDVIPNGANSINISVHDQNGSPVSDALVTLLKNEDEIFISKLTSSNGQVIIPLEYDSTGEVLVTITKKNMIPYEGDFRISNSISAGILDEAQIILLDQSGNNDNIANPGELISLILPIVNSGSETLTNVSAELVSSSNMVNIVNSNSNYGSGIINQGEIVYNDQYFTFEIDPSSMDYQDLGLMLSITSNDGLWQSRVPIDVHGTRIGIGNILVNGFGNTLNSSGSSYLSLYLDNIGRVGEDLFSGELVSLSPGINVITQQISWENIYPNSSNVPTSTIEIEVMDGVINGSIANFQLNVHNESGYQEIFTFNISVGQVTVSDPLGPDSYGYYIYDSGDSEYDLAPDYNWIEIDPAYGGDGNDLNITDNGDNQDESQVVNLPFTFRFYGKDYDQITICSNGWISFGETEMESFRNYNLPGAGGPSPMLAVFWDDLTTTNGGDVFTKYIQPQNNIPGMFIIEWSDVHTYDEYSIESFQAILYQNAVLPNFDGEIKLQYKEFNNTTNGDLGSGWNSPPLHGSYCTVGIEDETGLTGLEYTFNNNYPEAALPLFDQSAIFITTQTGETLPPAQILTSEQSLDFNMNLGEIDFGSMSIENVGEDGSILMYSLEKFQFLNPGGVEDDLGMNWSDSERESQILYDWIDISDDNVIVDFSHNDDASGPYELPFSFRFYGYNYSSFIINPNGWVGFASDNDAWSNTPIPNDDAPRPAVFAFWDDLNPLSGGGGCSDQGTGSVYYKHFSNKTVITYDEVAFCSGADDGLYTFQIVLNSTGSVEINYNSMEGQLSSATIGIQNGNGSIAQQVVYNNSYVQDGLKLVFDKTPSWISLSGELQGQVLSGSAVNIDYTVNTENLIEGQYTAYLSIVSNAGPTQIIPINLNVENYTGLQGDVNDDGLVNVSDILVIISFILMNSNPSEYETWASDLNNDGFIDVVDIIALVNNILGLF